MFGIFFHQLKVFFYAALMFCIAFVALNFIAQSLVLPVLRPALEEAHQGLATLARDVRDGVRSPQAADHTASSRTPGRPAAAEERTTSSVLERLVGDFGGTITERQDTPQGRFYYVSVPNSDADRDEVTAMMVGARRGSTICIQVWEAQDGRLDISSVHSLKCAVAGRQG